MIWLGEKRGYLSDWTTQVWVRATGRRVDFGAAPWLAGPAGPTRGIGREFFFSLAKTQGLEPTPGAAPKGILPDFTALRSPELDPEAVAPEVRAFYQQTSAYELEAWSKWCGVFWPFGWLLSALFSRRLKQLNVPLSSLDTSRGLTNEVVHFVSADGSLHYAVWLRELVGTKNVLYCGSYSVCQVPEYGGVCLKVVFPLPNGNALVLMRPEVHADGSLSLVSAGRGFGWPGFYFVVHGAGELAWARYVRTMQETIHVYPCGAGEARADHTLKIWRQVFLRLHYRLRRQGVGS